jgi:chromosome segregation ATPase
MVEGTADFNGRLASVEHKVDALAASMDQRFDEVTAAILEQRRYTDVAFDQLTTRISGLEKKVDSLDTKFDSLERQRTSFETKVESRFARLDHKLDQLIDRG